MSVLEVVATWGDTVVERTRVAAGASYALADVPIVRAGVPLRMCGRVGQVAFVVARVDDAPRPLPYPLVVERRWGAYLAVSLLVHLVVWGVAHERAPVEAAAPARPRTVRPRLVHVHAAPEHRMPPSGDIERSPDDQNRGAGAAMAIAGASRAGHVRSTREHGHVQLARRTATPAITRAEAIARARAAGLLGSLPAAAEGIASVVGTAELASGFDAVDTTGPRYGGHGEAHGGFGVAFGDGRGGGCAGGTCGGLIGTGRYGTLSNGTSAGDGWGGGPPGAGAVGGRSRRRAPTVPTIILCGGGNRWQGCGVQGGLDKETVRRYVRRALPKILYCFERELLADPSAAATVHTQFLIGPDGRVQAVSATGGHPNVATCIAEVIRAIEFPASKQGGATQVNYPFRVHLAGT